MKKLFCLMLAFCVCLSFAGCGDEPAGKDWRTWGTITTEGDVTIDDTTAHVLISVYNSSTVFYHDISEQIEFATLEYPKTLDASKFSSIDLDDLNFDGNTDVQLTFSDDSGDTILVWLWYENEGYLYDDELSYFPGEMNNQNNNPDEQDVAQAAMSYFEQMGVELNAEPDNGKYELPNGAVLMTTDYKTFYRTYADWEVKITSDKVSGDERKIKFTAICYIPDESIPDYDGDILISCSKNIFDAYTGYCLTAERTDGNTSKGDNTYSYALEFDGTEFIIEYSYSTRWEYYEDGYRATLYLDYDVSVPVGYDGLVFAAHTAAENKAEFDRRDALGDGFDNIALLQMEDYDPSESLFFGIK